MNRFNHLFYRSIENTTSQLYDEMNRLVQLYAANFLSAEIILTASDNLKNLEFDEANQVCNEELELVITRGQVYLILNIFAAQHQSLRFQQRLHFCYKLHVNAC